MNRIDFRVEKHHPNWGEWEGVVPFIDGVSLVNLVAEYETAHGFVLPGSYDGITAWRKTDPYAYVRYLLGEINPEDGKSWNGHTWLLGCNCSVAGCWPLEALVTVDENFVKWDRFRQPHRPSQDYSGFGPFVFARDKYDRAVEELAATLAALDAEGA